MGFFDQGECPTAKLEPDYYQALREKDFVSAVSLLKRAATHEDGHAMAVLGSLYAMGRGVEKDETEAALWTRQGAVRGDVNGMCALGVFLAAGFGCNADIVEASYWLYRAGSAGNKHAVDTLSDLALRDPNLVGRHFSQAEFDTLLRARYKMPQSRGH